MKKLDWDIINKFLSTFFFSIFLFTVIAVVVDISEKADDFAKSGLTTREIVTQYNFGFVPYILALLFPLFIFIAVIFFSSKMAGRSEIVAILASGTTYNRWLRPYWIAGILLALMLLAANLYIVPKANVIRGNFEAKYLDPNSSYENLTKSRNGSGSDFSMKVDTFTYAGIYNYDTVSKRGGTVFLDEIRNNQLVKNTRAEGISWYTLTKQWKLEYVVQRVLLPLGENVQLIPALYKNLNFTPFDIRQDKYTKDRLTSRELARFIKLQELRGAEGLNELKVEAGRRYATPITVILLTLIGAIVAGRKVRGGSGLHLAAGFIIAALFIITDKFSTIFSTKGNLPPSIAPWIPNCLVLFVVIYLHRRAPK
jgi:lipopolysaccharide export system permease protein